MNDRHEPPPFDGLAGLDDLPAGATWVRHPDYGNPNIDLVTGEPLFPIGQDVGARRRALAFNAVGPAINAAGYWLPLSARRAVADAVLAAVHAAELEASQRRTVALVERIDAARTWARQHLTPELEAGLLGVLRGDQPKE